LKSTESLIRDYRKSQAKEGPADRWRKPVVPVAVEHDPNSATHDGNVTRAGYHATFDADTVERFRLGRACLRCWEPLEEALPNMCPLCGYGVREYQRRDFEQEFEGEKFMGPTTSLSDEYERMILNGKKKRHVPGSQIILPRGVGG
jgi:hypothetical protein